VLRHQAGMDQLVAQIVRKGTRIALIVYDVGALLATAGLRTKAAARLTLRLVRGRRS
jgi:hypothetical protein